MISVIIPAYNAEKYIERAINSVLKQTYNNYEIIVVNDGSTDATREIVKKYCSRYDHIILVDTSNGGVSRARNIGIDEATGEYIIFLDADDELFPDALEKMLACITTSGADIVCANSISDTANYKKAKGECVLWSREQSVLNLLADHRTTYSAWGKIYKKNKLDGVRFPEGKRVHEDSFFVFMCIIKGMSFAVCDYITHLIHKTPNSASRSPFSEKFFDITQLAEEKKHMIDDMYPEYREKSLNIMIKANMALLHNLCKAKGIKYWKKETDAIQYILKHKNSFIPAIESDKRWFYIITHHLYRPYKFVYQFRYRDKI